MWLCPVFVTVWSLIPVFGFLRPYVTRKHAPTLFVGSEADIEQSVISGQNKLLVDIWNKIAFPGEESVEQQFRLQDYGLNRRQMEGFIQHFQNCKDCAADHAFLMATQNDDNEDVLQLNNAYFPLLSEEDDDEWGMFDRSLLGDEEPMETEQSIFPVEPEDKRVLADSKQWVQSIIADFGVCPFTIDPDRAGIPQGGVRYTISRATNIDEAFYMYWNEIQTLLTTDEKEISTTLLIFPELDLFGDYELFEAYCECLSDSLCGSSMGFEKEIQLVFFHPRYQFRDGQARTGDEMGAANFARRSPWPMINLLRTNQVRAAQKGIPTGIVYKQNEERLSEVGAATLTNMLYSRNWEGLPVHSASKLLRVKNALADLAAGGDTSKCPVDHNAREVMEEVKGKCPVDHSGKQVEEEVESVAESSTTTVAKTVADYEKFAEDMEKWLRESS